MLQALAIIESDYVVQVVCFLSDMLFYAQKRYLTYFKVLSC
jgi:hypothetical protein